MPIISRIGAAAARGFGLFGAIAAIKDAYFNYVTLLLPGNGTNGAQNNTFLDSSSNAFTITRNGNTTQGNFSPFSQTGWGNYFNGSSDYLSVANNAALNLGTGDFTIECWVYPISVNSGNANPVINKLNGATNTGWLLGMSSTSLWQFSTGLSVIVRAGSVTLNQWTHLAAVRSSGTTTLYVNGTSVGTDSTSYNFTDAVSLLIGYNSSFVYCNCYVSNARVVKGTAVYTGNFTPSTTPLTAVTNTQLLTCQSNRFVDNSANAFAITATGSPSVQAFSPFAPTAAWSASTNGGSGYFDGSGDYLTAASNAAFDMGSGDFTIEFWLYPTSLSGTQAYITRANNSSTFPTFEVDLVSSTIQLYTSSTGSSYNVSLSSSIAPKLNAWNHVAATRNGSTFTIWVNGASGGTATSALSLTANGNSLGVGGYPSGTNTISGYLADVRIVKGTAVYTAAFTPPTAPLTAISGTSLLLSATNGGIVDATAKNDLETVGNAQISTTQSKFGGSSINFDGTGDYLSGPTGPNLAFSTGDFTVEGWVYFSAVSGTPTIFSSGTYNTNQFTLRVSSSKFQFYAGNGGTVLVSGTTTLSTGTWYHFAVVRSSGTTKLYVNGTSEATDSTAFTYSPTGSFAVGETIGNTGQLNGYIDDLRITKGVARYTSNFTPPTAAFPIQ